MIARLSAVALVVSPSVGCGDDDRGGDPPRYVVEIDGVSGSTSVSTLGADEQREICQSYDTYVETYVDLGVVAQLACLPTALWLGGSEEGCEERLAECVELFPEPIEVRASADGEAFCFDELSQCEASVAELEGCINLNLDLVFEVLDDWSCALYGEDDVMQQAQRMTEVIEVCADLDASCNRFAYTLGPD